MSGYQVMPRLTPDEYAELEQSIRENGVQVPITVGPDGRIIDGHHRDEIARKHDLHCPRVTARGNEQKLRSLAFSLNLHRRHLTREQKRQIVAESIKADPQLSDREHGRRAGVSKNTAAAVRDELTESGQVDHFPERIDPRTGNASQPASRPRPVPEFDQDEEIAPGITADELDALNAPEPENHNTVDPQKPRRRSLADQYWGATLELKKAIDRMEKLANDDRFTKQKGQIADANLPDLTRSADDLNKIITQLKRG